MLIEKDINPQSPRYLLIRFIKMQLDLELSSNNFLKQYTASLYLSFLLLNLFFLIPQF